MEEQQLLVDDRPCKTVVQSDVLDWLARTTPEPGHALVASLPDFSEPPRRAIEPWKAWFALVVERICSWAHPSSPLIFYQSDVRHAGTWIDKAFLVEQAAQRAGAALLAHRIVCRRPAGTATTGRAGYSHLLVFSKVLRGSRRFRYGDVIPDGGPAAWVRGIGLFSCEEIVRTIRRQTPCDTVVHLFCGRGLLLEVAREHGLHAIGVDWSRRQCRHAQRFDLQKFRSRSAP